MNNRIEELTLLQTQYENDKANVMDIRKIIIFFLLKTSMFQLENVKTLLQSFEGMSMKDMIEIGENVRTLANQAAKNIDDTSNILFYLILDPNA